MLLVKENDYVELMAGIEVGGHGIHCCSFTLQSNISSAGFYQIADVDLM